MNKNLIKIKQIDSGDLNTFVQKSSLAHLNPLITGASGVLNAKIVSLSGTLQSGIDDALGAAGAFSINIPVTVGVDNQILGYGTTFDTTPKVSATLVCLNPNDPLLEYQIYNKSTSGCMISFSNVVPSVNYSVDILLDT